jgi:rhodanese-related sulfurtransferase
MPERIDAARTLELRDRGAQLVEVLPEQEYRERHLAGAVSLPR